MRAEPHEVDLVLALVVDPGADQVLAEHAALEQELVVRLERVERLVERARNLRDLAVRLLEEVVVGRRAVIVMVAVPGVVRTGGVNLIVWPETLRAPVTDGSELLTSIVSACPASSVGPGVTPFRLPMTGIGTVRAARSSRLR